MTFEEFVTKYVNKKNANGMYYRLDEIPCSMELAMNYISIARDINYQYVMSHGKPCDDAYLIQMYSQRTVL